MLPFIIPAMQDADTEVDNQIASFDIQCGQNAKPTSRVRSLVLLPGHLFQYGTRRRCTSRV